MLQKTNFEIFKSRDQKTQYAPKYEKAHLKHILYMPEKKLDQKK